MKHHYKATLILINAKSASVWHKKFQKIVKRCTFFYKKLGKITQNGPKLPVAQTCNIKNIRMTNNYQMFDMPTLWNL